MLYRVLHAEGLGSANLIEPGLYSDTDLSESLSLNADAPEFVPSNLNNKITDHQSTQTTGNKYNLIPFVGELALLTSASGEKVGELVLLTSASSKEKSLFPGPHNNEVALEDVLHWRQLL